MAIAGKILIRPRGDYDSATQYKILDLVKHNGTVWLSKTEVCGIEPSDANSEYWMNMFDVLLEAETLTNEQFNITADTVEDFFKGVAEYAVTKEVETNETKHYKCIWANNDYFTIFCTKNPDNTLTLFGYRRLGGTYIAKYDIAGDAIADFNQFANLKNLSYYLLKTGGVLTGSLGSPDFYALLNGSDYGQVQAHVEGTATQQGVGLMRAGNRIPKGTAGNARGLYRIYGNSSGYTDIYAGNDTANNVTLLLPATNGTLALLSDIPDSSDATIRYNSETDFFEVLKDGEWESTQIRAGLNKLYLYDNGDVCSSVGGAWISYASKPSGVMGTPKIMSNSDLVLGEASLTINPLGANYCSTLFKENTIDLTGYDKLYIDWDIVWTKSTSTPASVQLVITSTKDNNFTLNATLSHNSDGANVSGKEFIDVSALNGEFYIGIYKYEYNSNSTATIRQIWAE